MPKHDSRGDASMEQRSTGHTPGKARGKQEEDRKSDDKPIPVTQATDHGTENADNSEYTDGRNIGP